jgi:hypothetical protein
MEQTEIDIGNARYPGGLRMPVEIRAETAHSEVFDVSEDFSVVFWICRKDSY